MSAAVIIDVVQPSQHSLEVLVRPESRPTRVLDDDFAAIPPGVANEIGAYDNEAVMFKALGGVLGARVISDRDESARNGDPQNADEPVTDPMKQHALSPTRQKVKGGSTITLEWRGNPTAECVDR